MNFLLRILLLSVILFKTIKVKANDSTVISQLITDIAKMQYAEDGKYNFHKGMFYSYKRFAGFPQRFTPDNNIFFTGLIAFSLKNLLPYLNEKDKEICKKIISNAADAYPYYQNKSAKPTYFFWEGGKPIMPNTYIVQHLSNTLATSEDIDDSIILLMATVTPDSAISQLKLIMDSAANGKRRVIKNTFKKYKNLRAHSTYLGSKMRVDFDFAVHCNVLYFLLQNKLPFNQYDSATVALLQQMIHSREYVRHPHYIAPYYIKPSVILYHLARLMGRFTIPSFEPYRKQIANDIKTLLQKSNNTLEDIILRTSLLRLGENVSYINIRLEDFKNSNQNKFVFYEARAGSQLINPFKRIFINFNMLNYQFFCPAYNKVLLLEYLVERNRK